jgi:DNA-binding SARP family transcriptional activator
LGLYRSGRQADALRAIDDARRTLREELGVDMSRPLQDLETAILTQDRALDLERSPVPGAGVHDRPAGGLSGSAAMAAAPAPATT